jgi:prepilin-type N-terminal cleavage/methylation domain-containing protein
MRDLLSDTPEIGQKRGFTLVEVLVVVSLLGLLSSITLASVQDARKKADSVKRVAELREIQNALMLFYGDHGRMPLNYGGGTADIPHKIDTGCADTANNPGGSCWGACDGPMPGLPGGRDGSCPDGLGHDPCAAPTLIDPEAYSASMQELVDGGYLPSIPHGSSIGAGYCYFDYGSNDPKGEGAMVVTILPDGKMTTTGPPGSCRPEASMNGTWCESLQPNTSACYCIPY